MRNLKVILKYQTPSILWAIFIFVLCTCNTSGFKSQVLFNLIPTDKLGHLFIFSVQVFFLMLGILKYWRFPFLINKIRWLSFSIAVIYGLFIEIYQHYFTADRFGDYWDLFADIIGAALGLLMFHSVYGNVRFLEKD